MWLHSGIDRENERTGWPGTRRDAEPREAPELRNLRVRMVAQLRTYDPELPITSPSVLEVMARVPRHEFVPPGQRAQAYENHPLTIGEGQTISQPFIVALMTQLLDLKGSERVLEIGTGSGYQAAILGELAREVHTVEIRPHLHERAKVVLEELQARGELRSGHIVTHLGDGSLGYPPAAPYDAIIATAAPREIPPAILEQLGPGGRLVIPVGEASQDLRLIKKSPDGTLAEVSVVPVRFVPMASG